MRDRLIVIAAHRAVLLDARDGGTFGAGALNAAPAVLDADQIGLELRGDPVAETCQLRSG